MTTKPSIGKRLLGAMLAVALVACPLLAAVGLRAAVES